MKRLLAAALLAALATTTMVASAQNDCGDGLPCGKIPWDLPPLAPLPSPTPMPTVAVTLVAPTQTPGGPTATPIPPTAGGFDIDVSGISDQFGTLESLAGATTIPVMVSGTPVSTTDQLDTLTENTETFFSYVRGVTSIDMGGLNSIFGFVTVAFLTVLTVKVVTLLLPVLTALFGLGRKVISVVLDFLPL